MKRVYLNDECDFENRLRQFYKQHFDNVANTILYRLATHDGTFKLYQRQVCIRNRSHDSVYVTLGEIIKALTEKRKNDKGWLVYNTLGGLQFGPNFPSHYLNEDNAIIYPPILTDKTRYMVDVYKPRKYEKKEAIDGGHASPFGEVVLDVDLDCPKSYDRTGICKCGTESKVCDTCWATFLNPAQAVLEYLVREVYGFKRTSFKVFSGRRGFHYWIVDPEVIAWTGKQRKAFAQTIEGVYKRTVPDELYRNCYDILVPYFESTPALHSRFTSVYQTGSALWNRDRMRCVMQQLYPKIDLIVTADACHLHKVPLTLHPRTGNLCVCMFPVASDKRFVPSQDSFQYGNIPDSVLYGSEAHIKRVLDACVKKRG